MRIHCKVPGDCPCNHPLPPQWFGGGGRRGGPQLLQTNRMTPQFFFHVLAKLHHQTIRNTNSRKKIKVLIGSKKLCQCYLPNILWISWMRDGSGSRYRLVLMLSRGCVRPCPLVVVWLRPSARCCRPPGLVSSLVGHRNFPRSGSCQWWQTFNPETITFYILRYSAGQMSFLLQPLPFVPFSFPIPYEVYPTRERTFPMWYFPNPNITFPFAWCKWVERLRYSKPTRNTKSFWRTQNTMGVLHTCAWGLAQLCTRCKDAFSLSRNARNLPISNGCIRSWLTNLTE